MSDHDFERPGAVVHADPAEWPYHVPPPEAPPPAQLRDEQSEDTVVVTTNAAVRRPRALGALQMVMVAGAVGALLGGIVMAAVMQPEPEAVSIPITLDTFPRTFMGADRNDLNLRDAGFGPTVERLDREFTKQLESFRFAYGGRGAVFGYGRLITLTIVDGILTPGVPREGQLDLTGRVRETRRLVSLNTPLVSCTFEPQPNLDPDRGIEELGMFSTIGHTECVLVDRARNLSLRLADNPAVEGSDSVESASAFSTELEGLHAQLIG